MFPAVGNTEAEIRFWMEETSPLKRENKIGTEKVEFIAWGLNTYVKYKTETVPGGENRVVGKGGL